MKQVLPGALAGLLLLFFRVQAQAASDIPVVELGRFQAMITRFNKMEDENRTNLISNAKSWPWLEANVPCFECSDTETEEIYWYRWWAVRKHLVRRGDYFAFTEFLNFATPISSALGHHIMELRWLRDRQYVDQYIHYWLRGDNGGPQALVHKYSSWLAHAVQQRALADGNTVFPLSLLDELVADHRAWEKEKQLESGLFWQFDVRDAMEESISGSRKEKNIRPTINSYMFGNAQAIAALAKLAGRDELAAEFDTKAARLRQLVLANLWDADAHFFKVRHADGKLSDAREALGFIPWYFNLPDAGKEAAWAQLMDPEGFHAPYGITTAERRHPLFRSHGCCGCEWDGAVWPFATSQTLTALANVLRHYPGAPVSRRDYFESFRAYVKSHRFDGKPYVGEYLDETTGQWLKGRQERSRYYNHSTFSDLLITGIVGLVPRADEVVEVDPFLPAGTWDWFLLDRVPYHGRSLTIAWDATGARYGKRGLRVWADGRLVAEAESLKRMEGKLKP